MKSGMYVSIAWVLSVVGAYAFGWWAGVKSAANVATGAVKMGFPVIGGVVLIALVLAAIAAFRMRGYLDNRKAIH